LAQQARIDAGAAATSATSSSSSAQAATVSRKAHLLAESCRFVTTGIVRGDTLKDLERAANVVADRIIETASGESSSSSDPSVKAESTETVSRTPADLELATVPRQLFDAVGDLDMDLVQHLLDTYFDEDFTNVMNAVEQPTVGRDDFYQFLYKISDRTPDAIRVIRHSRVVFDEAGNKAVKFKMFETGTYIKAKNDSENVAPGLQSSTIIRLLDESSASAVEIEDVKSAVAPTTDSFTYVTHSAICWHLNGRGTVQHADNNTKFVSMKPFQDAETEA
jgi:hypothetical protein